MKTVGKQLEEARLAKNWTPELAARETKIKVDRLRDLESDDYTHFNNATYARGFVRTYARALGLDEYKILRQLDNKLPDDDSANIASDGGVAYLPETALPPRAAHRDFTGLYIVMGLGGVVALAIVFVLFEAYRVGELSRWMGSNTASNSSPATTNTTGNPENPGGPSVARALPIDSNTPPPIAEPAPTNSDAATPPPAPDSSTSPGTPPRALPVDPSALNANATPPPADIPVKAPRALPVNLADLNNGTPPPANTPVKAPPRALPVNLADLAATSVTPPNDATPPPADIPVAAPAPVTTPVKPTNAAPVMEPSMPALQPAPAAATSDSDQPLILTASRDSFVRVTALDTASGDKAVYAAVLHSGQSVGFNGHKFSVNVDNPSAVDIKLDGVNYGPHSDHSEPETFTVVSHVQ